MTELGYVPANPLIMFLAFPSLKTGSPLSFLLFQHLWFSMTKIAANMPIFYFFQKDYLWEPPCCILRRGVSRNYTIWRERSEENLVKTWFENPYSDSSDNKHPEAQAHVGTGAVHPFLPGPLPLYLSSLLHAHIQSSPIAAGGWERAEFPGSEHDACFLQQWQKFFSTSMISY